MKRRNTGGGKAAKSVPPKRRGNMRREAAAGDAVSLRARVRTLERERDEALEQQTATSEVLRLISSLPGELAPVFEAILANATRICSAKFGSMYLREGDGFRIVAMHNAPAAFAEARRRQPVVRPRSGTGMHRVSAVKRTVHIIDLKAEQSYLERDPMATNMVERAGARTLINVPMLKDGELVGVINIYRQEVRPFTEKQIALVQNFAAQAVIAIENTRLLNELRQRTDDLSESLDQQTATSEVLKVISSSQGELEPVFNTMLENAVRICGAQLGNLALYDGRNMRVAAMHNPPPAYQELRQREPAAPSGNRSLLGVIAASKSVMRFDDLTVEPYVNWALPKLAGAKAAVGVPMLRDGELAGAIVIYRTELRAFTDKQIELVQNFAAQAVIAIENARLLNELRQRTDDLSESLEQQTATSEVLKVISSSPGELEPVFQAILENAVHICGARSGGLSLREGQAFRNVVMHGVLAAYVEERRRDPLIVPTPGHNLDRLLRTKAIVHIPDLAADKEAAQALFESARARALLNVPLLKDQELIGSIMIYREEAGPFTDKQIDLVQNFAAQAVIAIENARLLNELRQRTGDLSESLERQTATSEVLNVISNSLTDTQPVFDAIVRSGLKLFGDAAVTILLPREDKMVVGAIADADPKRAAALQRRLPIPLNRDYMNARAVIDGTIIDIPDVDNPPADLTTGAKNFRLSGFRAVTIVPMMRSGAAIGSLSISRAAPGPLSGKQVAAAELRCPGRHRD